MRRIAARPPVFLIFTTASIVPIMKPAETLT
jgi:hypothetical protein